MRPIIQSSVTHQDNKQLSMEQHWPVQVLMICKCCWQNLGSHLTCPRPGDAPQIVKLLRSTFCYIGRREHTGSSAGLDKSRWHSVACPGLRAEGNGTGKGWHKLTSAEPKAQPNTCFLQNW